MGFESTHRQVREQLAQDLARIHNLDLARAVKLLVQAERLAVADPAQRSIRQLFVVVLRRAGARDAIDAAAPVPGRETLVTRLESLESLESLEAPAPSPPVTEAARAESLESSTRSRMEQAFGVDFHGVSIFRDSALAAGSTRARAKDGEIHFRRGAYRPGTAGGDRLIAHELAHIVQQRGGAGTRAAARHDLEREADRAAGQIARGQPAQIALRGQPGAAYAYDDNEAHNEAHSDAPAAPPAVEQDETGATRVTRHWLDALGGSTGRPLPADLRSRLEAALRADLAAVRVHDGAVSDAAAKQINANAFTLGKNIHFARGRYQPSTRDGQELIAHEVAHTVQAGHGSDAKQATISAPGDSREVE
ncbi:MAG TPA: DUF4157 domain-containing protein, partial [Kofleriaceae bacterium]|nr:DUF4157 domain-containing protein [Kofleriaceae bacterium]